MRKPTYYFLSLLLVLVLICTGTQSTPTRAQAATPDATAEFPVTVEFTGVIKSIKANKLTLGDGSEFIINAQTVSTVSPLKVGLTVTIVAEMNDDGMVAVSIAPASADAVTPAPSNDGPGNSGNGKGKGN